MIDQVLEGQHKLVVDFNEKMDDVYNNLNDKFEALSTHVKKLETQVIKTSDVLRRQEALVKGKGEAGLKHYVNAIIDDDFWQVVKHAKLQGGEFQVKSSMLFGSTHWSRSTPSDEHRSISL